MSTIFDILIIIFGSLGVLLMTAFVVAIWTGVIRGIRRASSEDRFRNTREFNW